MSCLVMGCVRPAYRGDLCAAHYQRQLRGQPLDLPVRPRRASVQALRAELLEAALQVWDVETDRDLDHAFDRAMARLEAAADRFAHRDRDREVA